MSEQEIFADKIASLKGSRVPSSSTASYCAARKKLDEQTLSEIFQYTAIKGNKSPRAGLLKAEGARS